jgi:hypothetical protein
MMWGEIRMRVNPDSILYQNKRNERRDGNYLRVLAAWIKKSRRPDVDTNMICGHFACTF